MNRRMTAWATPPTTPNQWATDGVFEPGQIRLSARTTIEPNIAGTDRYGYVVAGDGLYYSNYSVDGVGDIDPSDPPSLTRVGGGWSKPSATRTACPR